MNRSGQPSQHVARSLGEDTFERLWSELQKGSQRQEKEKELGQSEEETTSQGGVADKLVRSRRINDVIKAGRTPPQGLQLLEQNALWVQAAFGPNNPLVPRAITSTLSTSSFPAAAVHERLASHELPPVMQRTSQSSHYAGRAPAFHYPSQPSTSAGVVGHPVASPSAANVVHSGYNGSVNTTLQVPHHTLAQPPSVPFASGSGNSVRRPPPFADTLMYSEDEYFPPTAQPPLETLLAGWYDAPEQRSQPAGMSAPSIGAPPFSFGHDQNFAFNTEPFGITSQQSYADMYSSLLEPNYTDDSYLFPFPTSTFDLSSSFCTLSPHATSTAQYDLMSAPHAPVASSSFGASSHKRPREDDVFDEPLRSAKRVRNRNSVEGMHGSWAHFAYPADVVPGAGSY